MMRKVKLVFQKRLYESNMLLCYQVTSYLVDIILSQYATVTVQSFLIWKELLRPAGNRFQ